MTERVAIVGSRRWRNVDAIHTFMDSLPKDTIIITGGASGVDTIAETYAARIGLRCVVYDAKWPIHGKSAGAKRNRLIVNECDRVVAFWDGTSPGTKITIDMAREAGKPVKVWSEDQSWVWA